MSIEEINQAAKSLSSTLGEELEPDIVKLIDAAFNGKSVRIGIREGYELISRDIKIEGLKAFDKEEETVKDNRFKPDEILENEDDYYFGAEEVVRFNERQIFLGVIGTKWFSNNMDDEFAEAIIFCTHKIASLDCMLGSVRVNNPFNENMYLAPGTIVVLQSVEFKNTKYLEVSQYLTKLFFSNDEGTPWLTGDYHGRFFWTGEHYSTISPYSHSRASDEDYEDDEDYQYDDDDYDDDYDDDDYGSSYSRYGGGPTGDLSDDFIDDVLGGEPDAYWNID